MKPSPIMLPIMINKLKKRIDHVNDPLLMKYQLSKIHLLYLMALYEHPDGFTLRALSEYLSFDKANTTRAISQLIEKGYVQKVSQGNLEHKFKVLCTPSGRLVAGEIWELNTRQNKDIQELFSEEELILLGSMANKLIEFLSKADL